MYVKQMCGYAISQDMFCILTKGLLDFYSPPTQESRNYKNWVATLDLKPVQSVVPATVKSIRWMRHRTQNHRFTQIAGAR